MKTRMILLIIILIIINCTIINAENINKKPKYVKIIIKNNNNVKVFIVENYNNRYQISTLDYMLGNIPTYKEAILLNKKGLWGWNQKNY